MLNLPAALGKILPDMVEPVFSAEDDLPSSEMKTNNVEWPSSMPPHLTVPSRWNVAGIDFCNLNGMATSPYWSECILIESLSKLQGKILRVSPVVSRFVKYVNSHSPFISSSTFQFCCMLMRTGCLFPEDMST